MDSKNSEQMLNLLKEVNTDAQNISSLISNLIQKVKSDELKTDNGLSFLELKSNLLLNYLINLTMVILRKCSGKRIVGESCVDRLIEIRTVLEKIRPIDHKLRYQLEKLIKSAVAGVNSDDPANFKANINDLIESGDDESADELEPKSKKEHKKSDIYVPPRLSAVSFDDETRPKRNNKQKPNGFSSSIMQDLKEEYLDTPIEIMETNKAQQNFSKLMKEKQEYEEEYMTRLPMSKEDNRRKRKLTTVGSLGEEITDFGNHHSKTKMKRKSNTKSKKKITRKKKFT